MLALERSVMRIPRSAVPDAKGTTHIPKGRRAMTRVPEGDLKRILHDVASAMGRDDEARKTAARWFNRLYYDVRKWNEGFILFLRTYPGFSGSGTRADFEAFLRQLDKYRESLEERYGTVKGDLCTSLKVLSARYPKDFG